MHGLRILIRNLSVFSIRSSRRIYAQQREVRMSCYNWPSKRPILKMFLIGLALISAGMFSDFAIRKYDPDKLPSIQFNNSGVNISANGERMLRCDSFISITEMNGCIMLISRGGHIFIYDQEGNELSHLFAPDTEICTSDNGFALLNSERLYYYDFEGRFIKSRAFSGSGSKKINTIKKLTLSDGISYHIETSGVFQRLIIYSNDGSRVLKTHFHMGFSPIRFIEAGAFAAVLIISIIFCLKNIDVFLARFER